MENKLQIVEVSLMDDGSIETAIQRTVADGLTEIIYAKGRIVSQLFDPQKPKDQFSCRIDLHEIKG